MIKKQLSIQHVEGEPIQLTNTFGIKIINELLVQSNSIYLNYTLSLTCWFSHTVIVLIDTRKMIIEVTTKNNLNFPN